MTSQEVVPARETVMGFGWMADEVRFKLLGFGGSVTRYFGHRFEGVLAQPAVLVVAENVD